MHYYHNEKDRDGPKIQLDTERRRLFDSLLPYLNSIYEMYDVAPDPDERREAVIMMLSARLDFLSRAVSNKDQNFPEFYFK